MSGRLRCRINLPTSSPLLCRRSRAALVPPEQSIYATPDASSIASFTPPPTSRFRSPIPGLLMKLPHLRADLKFDTLIMLDPTVPLREQALDLFDIRRRDDAARLDVRRQRALDVERPVFGDDLLLGAGVGVEIDRQTFAREMPLVGRQIDPLKAVPGIFVGFEDYRAIEEGRKRGNFVFVRLSWVRVKLDSPAPALIPFPVEVDQQI